MFRSFIYLDEDKLYTYKRQIDGKNDVQPKAVSQKKTAGFSAGKTPAPALDGRRAFALWQGIG